MSVRRSEWRAAVWALLLVLMAACGSQEVRESKESDGSQATSTTEAVSEGEPMADAGSESEAEMRNGEAKQDGEAAQETAPAEEEEVPMERRQVFLVEFKEPYGEDDLSWLREYGARVMSENNERSVTVWFAPKKEHAWATDERIARVTPMRR